MTSQATPSASCDSTAADAAAAAALFTLWLSIIVTSLSLAPIVGAVALGMRSQYASLFVK